MSPIIQRLISTQHQTRRIWVYALTALGLVVAGSRLISLVSAWKGPTDPMCMDEGMFNAGCDEVVRAGALGGVEVISVVIVAGVLVAALALRSIRRRQARFERLLTLDAETIGMIYPVENRVTAGGVAVRTIRSIAILHAGGEDRLRVSSAQMAEALTQLRGIAPAAQFGYDAATDLRV